MALSRSASSKTLKGALQPISRRASSECLKLASSGFSSKHRTRSLIAIFNVLNVAKFINVAVAPWKRYKLNFSIKRDEKGQDYIVFTWYFKRFLLTSPQ